MGSLKCVDMKLSECMGCEMIKDSIRTELLNGDVVHLICQTADPFKNRCIIQRMIQNEHMVWFLKVHYLIINWLA